MQDHYALHKYTINGRHISSTAITESLTDMVPSADGAYLVTGSVVGSLAIRTVSKYVLEKKSLFDDRSMPYRVRLVRYFRVCVCVWVGGWVYVYIYTCVWYVCVCVYVYVYIYIYVCVCSITVSALRFA